ncbi:phosphate ABC transporter substrate-binding protein [Spiroplasma eriocheiris]|uniref:Phosphate ABC transporter substrate-binding protein n=1 Tax=Spiroplasma eriocheiris TaxID=315358 RepID=A0A0H3XJ41_9MOLU|nr:phosphate ABC transporter substrate-binding protein [Spiroplasma eriocheiris]AHF58148.1 ABC-type phosphate transport system substrate-binding protein [Spiroplasma eriocheiris CCTCC M 207170]AKM54585.1 phosphate ABC transporter substrate-binding protein [Spiroplasma eriocheiris]
MSKKGAHDKSTKKCEIWKKLWEEITNHRMMTIIVFILILVVAIVIWTVSTASNVIVAGGSTSVTPIMNDITEQYKKNRGEDIVYNALGSAAALVGVQNGSYAFGFLSKDVNSTPKAGDNGANAQNLWNNKHVLRFVFARDYILLTYHLPNGCSLKTDPLTNKPIPLNFSAFFGGDGTKLIQKIYDHNITWGAAFKDQLVCSPAGGNSGFYTLTREAGSGTRDFFESSVIKTKSYSTDQVASSNGAMYQTLATTPGSIGYLSFSFIERVASDPELGIQAVASVTGVSDPKSELPYVYEDSTKTYDFNPDYSLVRPFTGIVNTDGKHFNKALEFIAWMLDPKPYDDFKKRGIPLTPNAAAYWYIHEGDQPLTHDDIYFLKYNNNTNFAINGNGTLPGWGMNKKYLSIWDYIIRQNPHYDHNYPVYKGTDEVSN